MAVDGEIIRGTISYVQQFASAIQNVFHWEVSGGNPTDEDVVTAIELWVLQDWHDRWQQLTSNQSTMRDIRLLVVNELGQVVRDLGTVDIGLSGTQMDTVTSAAVSAYMIGNTLNPTIRGSKYVPGIAEGSINNGALTNDALADLGVLLVQYLFDIDLSPAGFLIAGVLSSKLTAFLPFAGIGAIEQIPAYQRRRKPSVGE